MGSFVSTSLMIALVAAAAQGPNPATALHSYFDLAAKNQEFGGVVLVADHGVVVYHAAFGLADFVTGKPNTPDIRFPTASVSKTITSTAILQLAERGKLEITDPVRKHLPAFPYSAITIRHLLSHTSGLAAYDDYFDSVRSAEPERVFHNIDFLPRVSAQVLPLESRPGERWRYNNINYLVLALIVEQTSGQSFGDYVQQNILRPAAMTDTRLLPLSQLLDPNTKLEQFSFPHIRPHLYSDQIVRANTIPFVVSYWRAYGFIGFGDFSTTAL